MSTVKFSNSQKAAIKVFDKNTIVSAGAGSGKTAVLTERIKRIIASGISPKNLLVLTFTENAANNMKTRIRKTLKNDSSLTKYLQELDEAYICTIDAFSLSLCKKYFYKLNIKPTVSIIDNNIFASIQSDILDEIFEKMYKKNVESFISYLDEYSTTNDSNLKNNIIQVLKKIDLLSDTDSFLESSTDKYASFDFIKKIKEKTRALLDKKLINVKSMLFALKDITNDDKVVENVDLILSNFLKIKSNKDFIEIIKKYKNPGKTRGAEETDECKKLRTITIRDMVKEIISLSSFLDDNYISDQIEFNIKYTKLFIEIIKEYYVRIKEYKELNNSYTYTDIAKFAIKLLKDNEDVRKEVSNNFKYILLDEYQDTSDLQEDLLNYISNDNVYMVGDIKQSIYRFRNANPDLFKEKYNTYDKVYVDEEEPKDILKRNTGYRIDMTNNYRSREEVLDDINKLFNPIMTFTYGDADYEKSHQMVFGNKSYSASLSNYNHHLEILTYTIPSKKEDPTFLFTAEEVEAFIIGKDIINKINEGYEVYDSSNVSRKATYSDFCIIADSGKRFESFEKIFEYLKLPISINSDMDLTKDNVSYVLVNIIRIISKSRDYEIEDLFNDKEYLHCLVSIYRSFMYELDDSEIYRIVKEHDYTNEVSIKASNLAKLIDKYSNKTIYNKALCDFHFFEKLPTISSIKKVEHEAEYIMLNIDSLSKLNYTFKQVADYFSKTMFEENESIKYSLDHSKENGVKLMNIHKSKGLEFHICYFTQLDKNPNITDEKNPYFDIENGFVFPVNRDYEKDIITEIVKDKISQQRKSERLRLFYVALTRTMEKMIFVSRSFLDDKIYIKDKCQSFLDYLRFENTVCNDSFIKRSCKEQNLEELNLTKDYDLNLKHNINFKFKEKPFYTKLKKPNIIEKSNISKQIIKLISEKERANLDLGTKFHAALEVLDFKTLNIDSLNTDKFIKDKIKLIFSNEIFKDISNAKTFHEYEFEYINNLVEYHGIIDLLVVYNDHIDIIDYKLSNTNKEEYNRQLQIYKDYVMSKSNLKVNCYLLSLLKNEIKEVI